MRMKKIYYTDKFEKRLKKYSSPEKQKILKKIKIFWENPFSSLLKTHKLKGQLNDIWSFSISSNLRIIFRIKENIVEFIDIGNHEIYKPN